MSDKCSFRGALETQQEMNSAMFRRKVQEVPEPEPEMPKKKKRSSRRKKK